MWLLTTNKQKPKSNAVLNIATLKSVSIIRLVLHFIVLVSNYPFNKKFDFIVFLVEGGRIDREKQILLHGPYPRHSRYRTGTFNRIL